MMSKVHLNSMSAYGLAYLLANYMIFVIVYNAYLTPHLIDSVSSQEVLVVFGGQCPKHCTEAVPGSKSLSRVISPLVLLKASSASRGRILSGVAAG